MSKSGFISIFELTLVSANLDMIGLSLINGNTAQITLKGGGTRRVNIEADSDSAIITDTMKKVYERNFTGFFNPFFKKGRYSAMISKERTVYLMCYFQGQAVGEFCPCCQNCTDYLSVCIPIVGYGGYICAECDFSFCDYCPHYSECEEIWGKAVNL